MLQEKFFRGLIFLALLAIVLPSATASVCSDYRVSTSQNGVITATISDNNAYFFPPTFYNWSVNDTVSYEVLDINFSEDLNIIQAIPVNPINTAQNTYNFDFNKPAVGTWDINFILTDNEGILEECVVPATVVAEPDLNLVITTGIADKNIGEQFVFDANVSNNGGSDASNVIVSLTPGPATNFDTNAASYGPFVLAKDENSFNPFLITAKACIGNAEIGAIVNYENLNGISKPSVSQETTFTVSGANIQLTDLVLNNSNPVDGNMVRITATVKNTGELNILTSFDVNFTDANGLIDVNTINGLNANESKAVSVDWNTSGKIGSHNIVAYADGNEEILECIESDNNRAQSVVVNPDPSTLYDIEIISLSLIPPSVANGHLVNIHAVIKSDNASLNGVEISFKYEGIEFTTETVNLVAGQNTQVDSNYVPQTLGTKTITVVVDKSNNFNETNEGNNEESETVQVTSIDQGTRPRTEETAPAAPAPSGGGGGGGGGGGPAGAVENKPKTEIQPVESVEIPSAEDFMENLNQGSATGGEGTGTGEVEGEIITTAGGEKFIESVISSALLNKQEPKTKETVNIRTTPTGFLGLGRQVDFGPTGNTALTIGAIVLVLFGLFSFSAFIKKIKEKKIVKWK